MAIAPPVECPASVISHNFNVSITSSTIKSQIYFLVEVLVKKFLK